MNQQIADILKGYISGVNFVDHITGLIQVGYLTQGEVMKKTGSQFKFGELTQIKVPMSMGYMDCTTDKPYSYDLYYPDKKYKSVIFFEDGGVRMVAQHRTQTDYIASLRLVCWFNKKKINPNATCNQLIQVLNDLILDVHPNTADFNRIYVEIKGQQEHSETIYSKYDLDVGMYQFMMWPYDLFAIDYDISFSVTCFEEVEINPVIC